MLVALAMAGCGGEAAPTLEWAEEASGRSPPSEGEPAESLPPEEEPAESPPRAEESAEASRRPGRFAKKATAGEVAKYLDREFDFSGRRASRDRLRKIRIRIYASERQLRQAQRFAEKALGDLEPVAVTCGLIRVEVAAAETPDRESVEQRYAQDIERALKSRYDCR